MTDREKQALHQLHKAAVDAIIRLANDTAAPREATLMRLNDIRDEVEARIDAIEGDIARDARAKRAEE